MTFNEFKQQVIAKAEAMGITEYELYYQAAESTSVGAFQHEINQFTASSEGGVCFRCIAPNGKMGYASTEALTPEQAAAIVEKALDNASCLESDEPVFLAPGGQEYAPLNLTPYALPSTEALIAKVLDTQEKLYASDPRVVDGCSTDGICESSRIAICNSKGLDLQYENNLTALVVSSAIAEGAEKVDSYKVKVAELSTIDTDQLTKEATVKALQKLGGQVAPTGNYPVVFAPEAMASLLGVFSSVFSAEAAQKGLSRLAQAEGTQIAAPIITLVDDPFHPESPMPIHFDAEGSPTYTKNIIESGRLNTLLYNLKTAAVAGKATTGNASKAGYDSPIGLRPFTMYLAPGSITEEELLAKAANGVYIHALQGLHAGANPISGDFSLQSAGFMIENGVKTTAVKSFTVAGNFYTLLKSITAVADNVTLPHATGITAFGSPSVLVEGLSIAGK